MIFLCNFRKLVTIVKKIPRHMPLFFYQIWTSEQFVFFMTNLGFDKFFDHLTNKLDIRTRGTSGKSL